MKKTPRRPTLPMGLAPVKGLPRTTHPAHTRRTPRIDRYVKLADEVAVEDLPFEPARLPKDEVLDLWEELLPMLAWLSEDRRPQLLARIERSELILAASELRTEQERYPKNVSITRAIRTIERAAIRILLRALEPLDRVPQLAKEDTRMRPTMAAVARLVDGKRSLNGIMRDSELSRLETLSALEDLLVTGHIRFAPETLGERISESLPPPTRKPTMPAHFSLQPREDAPDPVPGLTEDMATPKAKDVTTAPPPRGDTSGDTYPALEGELGKSVPLSAIVDQDVRSDFDEAERPTLADPFEVERQLELTRQAASGASTPTAPAIAEDPTPPSAEERPSPPAGTEARATTSEPPAGSGRSEPPPSSERPPRSEPAPPEEEDRDSEPDPQASSRRSRTASAPPAAHRRTLYAVTAVAALSTTAAVYFGLSASQPDPTLVPVPVTTAAEAAATPSTAPAPGTATATSAPSASAAPAPELVRLRIDLTPDYARVYLDGKRVRPPYDYSLPKDDGTRIIRIEAPGHKARKVTYVAREDLRLVIALEPLPRLEKPTTDPVKPEASPPDPY